jgi:hypothetical protein
MHEYVACAFQGSLKTKHEFLETVESPWSPLRLFTCVPVRDPYPNIFSEPRVELAVAMAQSR